MNQERRQKITGIKETISGLQSSLDTLQNEEQEAYDILLETLQTSAKGDDMIAAIDSLDSASSGLQDVLDFLEGIP